MDIIELMEKRHAVRQYLSSPIEDDKRKALSELLDSCNKESGLDFQIFFDEKEAFNTFMAHYGKFSNVSNYIALVGKKDDEEKAGYYGEKLVLKAQELGLNTCWVALTYGKGKVNVKLKEGEKVLCVIALGYGATQGVSHTSKKIEDVLSLTGDKPSYLDLGLKAALLAPTAMNQQKFLFVISAGQTSLQVKGMGFYTKLDLGIVKYHFEAATGVKING
jgi:nitroreductase